MKPRLAPIYFEPGRDGEFDSQIDSLRRLLAEEAQILAPVPLGSTPPGCEAVLFPQMLGDAYRRLDDFRSLGRPILIVTSEFGTMSMWDWEIIAYLRAHGIRTIAPYSLDQTKKVCAAMRVRGELARAKFLVFQDNPGDGAQASIFKRFYWWEDECTRRMFERFGVTVVRRSFRELGARAKAISDADAQAVNSTRRIPFNGIGGAPLNSAIKLYVALKRELDADPSIRGVGINCLNESHFSDTTPCLAWSLLFEERKMIWGCEADTMSMLTKHIVHHSLGVPIMMTNLYPFLMGQAALKHERIADFPPVDGRPEDHVLVAHCGYLGVLPQSFATEWTLRKKVLRIVDTNATAIDARLPTGPVTLAKLNPTMDKLTVAEGELKGYAQYPGSDCLNGGVIKVRDGHRLMSSLTSHHYLLTTGHNLVDLRMIAPIFGLEIEEI
jgi:hypothetical protein